ncbi:MAG: porin, partial [Ramlibacter sp.]|nr:porin [Ramlibacter sp.]
MKKLKTGLLAGLLATACGGAAAQSTVQLMGLLDSFAGGIRMAGDPARVRVLNSGGMTTSLYGMKGSEDLGGGVKANFLLTSFLQVDTGVPGRFGGDPYFSRDASVGLSGSF